jgi:predicted permease
VSVLVAIFLSDILPIFIIAGIGFLLARWLDASVKTLAHVVFYALVPCLVLNLLLTSRMTGLQVGRMVAMAILVALTMGLIGRLAAIPLRLTRPELSGFLMVVMLSNGGNYGLPVVLFAFGRDALSHATVYFVTSSVLTYTVGVFLAASGRRTPGSALKGIIRVPAIYGLMIGAVIIALGLPVPLAIMRPVGMLSDASLPMMILVLGMQLERASYPDRLLPVMAAVALSLLVAPVVALGLARLLGVAGPARQAGVVLASMPVAVVTTILALEYDVAPAFVTSAVLASTVLSPLTLTPLIAYLR